METFYRVETRPNTEFLTGPHYSGPVEDACLACPRCGGEGEYYSSESEQKEWIWCSFCEGRGHIFYDPRNPEHVKIFRREGVSCFRTPEELIAYFSSPQAICPLERAEVIEFVGQAVGIGLDDEPLAIPEKVLRRWTWEEFLHVFVLKARRSL